MTRNTELFDAIADLIEEDSDRYDQSVWFVDGNNTPEAGYKGVVVDPWDCGGGRACIAGWAIMLHGYRIPEDSAFPRFACKALGIEAEEGDMLFDENWIPMGATWDTTKSDDLKLVCAALRKIGRGADIGELTATEESYHSSVDR